MFPKEFRYSPKNIKDLLTEMKDTSELMVDLAYTAMIYDDEDIAQEVLNLEDKMDTLDYHIKMAAMLSTRRVDEAEGLLGVLQVAACSENIANAAGDIAKIVLMNMGIPMELKVALREAEETVVRATIAAESVMAGRTLGDLELDLETGMWVIAIRRNEDWIYDPDKETRLRQGDVLIARGHDEGVPLFFEMATTRKFIPKEIEHNKILKDLEHAVDIIVDMKNPKWIP